MIHLITITTINKLTELYSAKKSSISKHRKLTRPSLNARGSLLEAVMP